MRKGAIIVTMVGVLVAAGAWGTTQYLIQAWGGATNINPATIAAIKLVDNGEAITNVYPYYYLSKMQTNNDVWCNWDDESTPEKDFNYFVLRFENDDYERAICTWEIRASGGPNIYLYAWDNANEDWDLVDNNTGGQNPGPYTVEVTDYLYQYLTLLAVGQTEGEGEDQISCDVCTISTVP